MTTGPKTTVPDLDFEQIEMPANFSDHSADFPNLSFEEITKRLGVDFSNSENGKLWEKECREVFNRERA